MARAAARSGPLGAQQVSLPPGGPPVITVTPARSWPSPCVSVGVHRVHAVGEERRLAFPQPERLQAAGEARAQPAEGLLGSVPAVTGLRGRMLFAWVPRSHGCRILIPVTVANCESLHTVRDQDMSGSACAMSPFAPSRIAPPNPSSSGHGIAIWSSIASRCLREICSYRIALVRVRQVLESVARRQQN